MPDFAPGDTILYRDGDRYLVARIELVKGDYYTAFPFCPLRRRWHHGRRRIARDFIMSRLKPTTNVADLARRIECLRNEREAKRQQANQWLQRSIMELTQQEQAA